MKKTKAVFYETVRYCAGIDLAATADHFICGPRNDDGTHDVEHFGTTTREIERMIAWCKERQVQIVAMESTCVYWKPVWDMFMKSGIMAIVVDTRTVKMVPGRKSDMNDCCWLQQLLSCGLLKPCFMPPAEFDAVRTLVREKQNVIDDSVQALQSMQKALDQMNVRVHRAVSDIDGVTGMAIVQAIVAGERDPAKLAELRDGRCKKSEEEIKEELTGTWSEEHLFNLKMAYERLLFLKGQIAEYDRTIQQMIHSLAQTHAKIAETEVTLGRKKQSHPKRAEANDQFRMDLAKIAGFDIVSIDGVGLDTACLVLAEMGNTLDSFPDERHFVSYVGLSPPLAKSAGKNLRKKNRRRNKHPVGLALRTSTMSMLRNSQSGIGALGRAVKSRCHPKAAVIAMARQVAKYIYRGMKFGNAYMDEGAKRYDERRRNSTVKNIKKKIRQYGISAEELGLGDAA